MQDSCRGLNEAPLARRYSGAVKTNTSTPATTSKNQPKASPQDANRQGSSQGGSTSQQATERAKQGEPLSAKKPSERSPKQENL